MVHQDLWAHFCKFHPLLHLYLIPSSSVSPVPPVILVGQDPTGPPRAHPALLGKLNVCLGLSFSQCRNHRPKGTLLVPHCTVLGGCSQDDSFPLTLLIQFFLLPVIQRDASASPPGSGIFNKVMLFMDTEVRMTYSAILILLSLHPSLPPSLHFFGVPSYFLVLIRYFSIILNVSCPSSGMSHFSREPWFRLLENSIRNPDLHATCTLCY